MRGQQLVLAEHSCSIHAFMKCLPLLVIALLAVNSASALSISEESAILAFWSNFPALASAQPAWTSNASSACDGPGFYGLTCSDRPESHILKLEFAIDGLEGSVPEEINGLLWLETFNITNACLSSALPAILSAPNLTHVELSDAPGSRCNAVNRTHTELPYRFDQVQLETLSISMSTLFGQISPLVFTRYLPALCHLRLTNPQETLMKLSGTFPVLKHLQTLNLAHTSISSIEASADSQFENLEELNLAYMTRLTIDLSPVLEKAPKLRVLNLSGGDPLLPNGILVPTLTHLIMDNFQATLSLFPAFWKTNINLQYLSARKASVVGFSSFAFSELKYLEYLDLTETSASGKFSSSIADCPLKVLRLSNTLLYPPIPDNIGQLSSTLEELELSEMSGFLDRASALPQSIGELTKLKRLSLYALSLSGTLPPSFANFTQLEYFNISNNALEGQLPNFGGDKPLYFDARNNLLTGTVPRSIASRSVVLDLSNNAFSGQLEADILTNNKALEYMSLAHNRFSGPLPNISAESVLDIIDMSNNKFNGSVPSSYCAASELYFTNNRLSSFKDLLEAERCVKYLEVLEISNNQLDEKIPNLLAYSKLQIFSAATNHLHGYPPRLPPSVRMIDLSSNQLEDNAFDFWMETYRSLTHLDLSRNSKIHLAYGVLEQLIGPNLTFLSLAHIDYGDSIRIMQTGPGFPSLQVLDLTSSQYFGTFPANLFPNLISLNIASNRFNFIALERLQLLTALDISHNLFEFDVSRFSNNPGLVIVNARNNRIFGSLTLDSMLLLQSMDLSRNKLDLVLDLASIGALFTNAQLRFLNISSNPGLIQLNAANADLSGLTRTLLSAPSSLFPDSLICYDLSFHNKTGQSLIFDEDLFSFMQCDCNKKHFGAPPKLCLACPLTGTHSCDGPEAVVSSKFFAYMAPPKNKTSKEPQRGVPKSSSFAFNLLDSLRPLMSLFSAESAELVHEELATIDDDHREQLATEPCLVTTIQTLSGRSNCKGISLTDKILIATNGSLSAVLTGQCREGSEGRLCSRCSCKPSGTGNCYYESGATCVRCSYVFPLSTSIPFAVGLFFFFTIVMTFIMTVMLRRKRKQSLQAFSQLPIWKRLFYRFLYLISLGHVSILITFLQLLIAFTEWDAYARLGFLGIINGGSEGVGLRCLFPLLADPLWNLLSRLSAPFLTIIVVAVSVGIGGRIANFLDSREKAQDHLDLDTSPILGVGKPREVDVEYPAFALMTSVSISVLKFFYFGTALSAHEYLFFSKQASTGILYAQNKPWMTFSKARPLIWASIPAILIFDFGIPLLFIIVTHRVRSRITWSSVRIYYGSLFESFRPKCFWWEIVNTLKKLSIALVLKALPSSDAVQSALVITILAVALLTQQRLNPWRRKTENVADGISSLLLVGALLYTRPLQISHSTGVVWYLIGLSGIFILANLGIIIFETVTGKTEYERSLEAVLSSPEHNAHREVVFAGESMDEWTLNSETEWRMHDPDLQPTISESE